MVSKVLLICDGIKAESASLSGMDCAGSDKGKNKRNTLKKNDFCILLPYPILLGCNLFYAKINLLSGLFLRLIVYLFICKKFYFFFLEFFVLIGSLQAPQLNGFLIKSDFVVNHLHVVLDLG